MQEHLRNYGDVAAANLIVNIFVYFIMSVIVYPNSLFEDNDLVKECSLSKGKVYIVEDPVYFSEYKYHKMKLVLHRSSMKFYENYVNKKYNIKSVYVEYDQVEKLYKKLKGGTINIYDPVEHMLDFTKMGKKYGISFIIHDTPLFLLDNETTMSFNKNKKLTHVEFYKFQRKKFDILLDDNEKPIGGKWSFDKDNRSKFPPTLKKDLSMPAIDSISSKYIKEAIKYVETNFPNNPGLPDLYLPITFEGVRKQFKNFIKYKLDLFGKYEDAVSKSISHGYHSILSPLMNIGLITPGFVVSEIKKIKTTPKNIASVEGYIRQVIGWREYCRVQYTINRKELEGNYFNSNNKLPRDWYTDNKVVTGFPFIDDMIIKTWNTGYLHHIERLMYIGNYALINQILPKDIFTWFQTMFIDSYHVFMYPNVYGMSQHSSGPVMMNRPYFSSSNYIKNMSDYKKDDIWDAVYYNFIKNNMAKLEKNYSIAAQVKHWKNKSVKEKNEIINLASSYQNKYFKR